jgi:4-amino-4-deoxy-L-arabinose transferase-like glycosyltransferase
MTRSRSVFILAALTLAGLGIRAVVAYNGGLWRDEALLLGVVDIPSWKGMLDYLRFHESHPPLFYAMMRTWRAIAGRGDTAALALPVFLSAALIPAAYAAAIKLFDRRTALVSAMLISISPPLVEYGASVRPYAFLALAILASTAFLTISIRSSRKASWIAYSASVVVLIYTHNWAWLVIAGHVVCIAFIVLRLRQAWTRILPKFLVSLVIAGVLFLPWAPTLLRQASNAGHFPLPINDPIGAMQLLLYSSVLALNATLLPLVEGNPAIVLGAAVIATAILILGSRRNPAPASSPFATAQDSVAITVFTVTPVAAFVIALGLYPITNLIIAACFSALAPVAVIAAASIVSRIGSMSISKVSGVRDAAVLAILVTMGGGYIAGALEILTHPRSNSRELIAAVNAQLQPDDLVIVAPGWLVSSVNHYELRASNQIAFPDSGGTRLFDFFQTMERMRDEAPLERSRRMIDEYAGAGRRVWLVTDKLSSRGAPESDRRSVGQMKSMARLARVRVDDLRRALSSTYGAPNVTSWPLKGLPRREEMFAELYGPLRR